MIRLTFTIYPIPIVSLNYRAPSALVSGKAGHTLALSARSEGRDQPFFQGRVLQPKLLASALICLSRVVGESWFDAAAVADSRRRMADPIVTSGHGVLRFEGFSACRSLAIRVDLLRGGLEILHQFHGTTNVDFNQPMRTALARVSDRDALSLAIDENAFVLVHGTESLLERKVELPLSWLKGLASIPVISSRCETVAELAGPAIAALFRDLPRTGNGRESHWLHPSARGIRVARTPAEGAVQLTGAKRLLVLQPLIQAAKKLTIATTPARDTTLWTLHFDNLRLTLALSPEVWRGFSGEGASLEDLSRELTPEVVDTLLYDGPSAFDAETQAIALGVSLPEIRTALAHLASQGQIGYDHIDAVWYRRNIPGSEALIRQTNPRLAQAEAWVTSNAVAIESRLNEIVRGRVGTDPATAHQVEIAPQGSRCTCFWFGRFGLSRGPCSHILALRLAAQLPP